MPIDDELTARWFAIPELRWLFRQYCVFCKDKKPWRHATGKWVHGAWAKTGCGANRILQTLALMPLASHPEKQP